MLLNCKRMEQLIFLLFLSFVLALGSQNVDTSEVLLTLPSTTTSFEIKEATKVLEKSTEQTQNLTNIEHLLKLETVLPMEPSTKQPSPSLPPTTTSKINSNTEHDELEYGETISFGIRSFTVEVSTNNKVSTTATTTSVKEMTTVETTKLPETTPLSATTATVASADGTLSSTIVIKVEKTSSASTTTTSALTSEATTITAATTTDIVEPKIVENHLTPSHVVDKEVDVLKSNLNILFNDGDSETTVIDEMRFNKPSEPELDENEISNEIQIDKKLDNGLYRIKIGEITTDEFNNGLNFNDANDDDNDERDVERQIKNKFPTVIPTQHHEHEHEHYVQPKVNIDDFFPSKMEDFKPIIEISNEKMLKQKNALHDDEVKHVTEIMVNDGKIKIATTNIEIDLIEDSSTVIENRESQDDTVSIKMEDVSTTTTTLKAPKINTDNLFIPRRAKKSDQLIKSGLTQGPTRIHDFGMTKFHQDLNNKTHNVKNQTVNGKPEFSTTKFYNSKELYSEILHKALKPSTVTASPKAPMNANNLIREKLLITNRIPVEVINAATTTMEPSTTLKTTITSTASSIVMPTSHLRVLSRLEEKINSLDCDIQNLSILDTNVWRGNETHELNLPITVSDFTESLLHIFLFYLCSFSNLWNVQT